MDTRTLGTSGLIVTRIGLGLAALGRPGYITLGHAADLARTERTHDAMRAHARRVLDCAWDAGIRYVDAARSYGLSEDFLAGWLAARGYTRAQIAVGSKWGYTYTAGWQIDAETHEVKDHTLPAFERQRDESLALIGRWLGLYQIHSATTSSGVLERPEVLDALARLRAGHGIAIGLTLSGPDSALTLERALAVERDGRRLFDSVQVTWNVLEPSLGPLLASARAAGMGIIVKEALANGRLTARNDDPAFATRRALLDEQATRLTCTLDQLALAAAIDRPWADCVLSGAATVEQLRSNLGAFAVRFDDAARDALAALAEPVDRYWSTRGQLRWN